MSESSTLPKDSDKDRRGDVWSSALYGCISALMVLPVSVSFCSIIFRDAAFSAALPRLVKLVLFSSAVHQLCFAAFSSLPFAVGQVQDAGLIFLSAMASDAVLACADNPAHVLPTTLFVLAVCTAVLGVLLIAVSKLRLASTVQYLPMPVVGGYLAFIGFYCGAAGLAMMAGWDSLSDVWASPERVRLCAPGVLCGVGMYLALRQLRSPFVLPAGLAAVLCVFFACMAGCERGKTAVSVNRNRGFLLFLFTHTYTHIHT